MYKKSILHAILITILFGMHAVAYAANNFALTDMAGKKHTLSQYKGKWVVVNYWATWCPPCLEEVPDLVALYDSRKNKDVMMLGVAFDYQSAKEVADYVDDMLMSYPIVLGDDQVTKQIGHSEVLPTTFIYDPSGKLIKTKHGLITKQYLEAIMVREKQ
ncbi:MAG: TlpA disulfide reductase family protein [Methylotenera sp.]